MNTLRPFCIDDIASAQSSLQAFRRDLHAHPELCFQEHRTSERIAQQLDDWGLEVHRGLGGTGVVGVLRGTSARAVALRADMDALPLQEANRFAHASQHAGRMHACGHDGHCAMLLGAAQYLAHKRPVDGTVLFIFQPAEEGGAGAQRMIEDGLFDRFPCEAVFGMHNWPTLEAGQFGLRAGAMMASSNQFDITLQGTGAHAAMPHLGTDTLLMAAALVSALQSIVSRNLDPLEAAAVSVTQLHAGSGSNIIADTATLSGTVRTFSEGITDHIEARIRQLAEHIALAHGGQARLRFTREYPPLVNHAPHTELAARVLESMVGAQRVIRDVQPTLGAEDFAFMLKAKPGCYVFIGQGSGNPARGDHAGPCLLHNPHYDFNDDILALGASYWVRLVEAFFKEAPLAG